MTGICADGTAARPGRIQAEREEKMDKRLSDVLRNRYGNYCLPFFWQRGDSGEVLTQEIDKIYESGIRAFCVESRVHEDFCGEGWWEDFGLILLEAEKRNMKVWLLDDKHFPTGYANGLVGRKYPDRRKWQILERHVDVLGPQKDAALLINRRTNDWQAYRAEYEESLIAVVACRRTGKGEELSGESVDLTDHVKGQFVYWNVPDGCWRVFFLFQSRNGAGDHRDYIHMIDPRSVDVLIEAVYEPHYRHFGKYFGNTFAGFFSDEPCFGNTLPSYARKSADFYHRTIGVPDMALPWREDLPELLSPHLGGEAVRLLPGLWFEIGENTSAVRTAYMDLVTRLYSECFSRRLGNWCRAHGVRYIGHIVEDMNDHARLGSSAGHFFRALAGQDMSGVDVVKLQIVPGMSGYVHTSTILNGTADPEFFDFVLAKLGSSLAHIHPGMKGRAMCELFGDNGWAEGLPMMKWLTDHMLVRGINYFVPHAFSPKFPDDDCPPHFYARGENPEFRDFKVLMEYTNKMSHLFSGGRHAANAAILYHAEAEWSGRPYMQTQVPAKLLCEAQIDFDILPADVLREEAFVRENRLTVGGEQYDCLIVPHARVLPYGVIETLSRLAGDGLCVIFVGGLPDRSAENRDILPLLSGGTFRAIPPDELVQTLTERGFVDIRPAARNPFLRFYHYIRDDSHFYLFFNEGMRKLEEDITLPFSGDYLFLDLMQDLKEIRRADGGRVSLALTPYQSCVLAFTDGLQQMPAAVRAGSPEITPVEGPFAIEIATAKEYPAFRTLKTTSRLLNVTGADCLPDFSGIMKYTAAFHAEGGGRFVLDLGEVGETARVSVNGKPAGTRICPPYRFDISEEVKSGENRLEVEVANSLAFSVKDWVSCGLLLRPSGLQGPVTIERRL